MREQRIILEPFELLDVLTCSGRVSADNHGYMTVKGHIDKGKEEEYLQLLSTDIWASVRVCDDLGNNSVLFTGIVTKGCIEVENGLKSLLVIIKTGSFLMDQSKHIRTFQNDGIFYDMILQTLLEDYPGNGFLMQTGSGRSIGRFLCQYEETDWQFAKRIASCCGTFLFPNYIGNGVKIYFGMPCGGSRGEIISTEYSLKQTEVSVSYIITDREIYDIGDKVVFRGKNYFVVSRESELKKGELYHRYELMQQEPQPQTMLCNDNLTGVSLNATVTGVAGTEITVTVKADENRKNSGSRRFTYATVYSSPDGTGWYCMPEEGDDVRIYFPSNKEDEAYAFSSAHMGAGDSGERVNPDYKSIMNKQGKEILFKPDSILITNNNGMSLELSDAEGIFIISNKKIVLQSEEAVEITSVNEKVDIVAPEKITLHQGGTKMVLSDNLTMKGAKIRMD